MPTSWPNTYARSDYAADKAGKTSKFAQLVQRDFVLARRPLQVSFAEASTTSTSYVTLASFELFVPDYAVGKSLALYIEGRQPTSGTDGAWRLQDNASATDGTEIAVPDGSASYANLGPSLLVIDAAWVGTQRTINVRGKAGAGTLNLRSLNLVALYFTD